ncbi:MAG: alanine:cation symporter family protein, partial [Candidatus Aminicenantales bacterium]
MIKKLSVIILFLSLITSFSLLFAADIKGQVRLAPKDKPYSHGLILLMPLGEEKYIKTTIDPQGNFIYRNLKPGKYLIKMDLYGLTPVEKEIEIRQESEILELDLSITLSVLDKTLVFIRELSDFMWSSWMIVLLLGTGILLTFLTRAIQVRRLLLSLKMVLRGAMGKDKMEKDEGDISPYAALMTALAATVGNGNIAGVATAIATGGPGAPVWMWIAGFFGMATKYSEG